MRIHFLECVPNFSEGADAAAIGRIVQAIAAEGIALLGHTSDPDHHRSVVTFAGAPARVIDAAVAGVAAAAECIDLTRHTGVHPRLGAADVVPFVPLAHAPMSEAVDAAHTAGERIWRELRIPVYFYEASARHAHRRRLENVRRGGFEKLRQLAPADPFHRPDLGGPDLHPTAGAVIVGARPFLIAWNVNLDSTDITVAKAIAAAIRESSGGLPHVKALGLELRSRGLVQVSMNLTDFERTPIPLVYSRIRDLAAQRRVGIVEAELIGFLPSAAYEQVRGRDIPFRDLTPDRVIEHRLAQILPPVE